MIEDRGAVGCWTPHPGVAGVNAVSGVAAVSLLDDVPPAEAPGLRTPRGRRGTRRPAGRTFSTPGAQTTSLSSRPRRLRGKGEGPGKVETAAVLVSQLALTFPGRMVHVVADAAYHGPALCTLPANVTWTCRIPRNAALYDLARPRTGRRGRPAPRASGWAPPTTSSAAAATRWRPSCTPSTTRSARPASPTGTPRSSATRWPAPPVRPGICDRARVILLRR